MILKRFTLIFSLLLVLSTAISITAQETSEDLNFALTFVPNIQFSPLYVAQEQGYFEEVGLNPIVDYLDENVIVDLIAANELQFGVVSGEQVILARSGGRPAVYVYEWFQQFPVGIVIPDTTDASTVADLQGLSVGVPGPFGATYSGLTALLAANGMNESDIQMESIGFTAPDFVCAGRVDAATVYSNNEPLQIQQRADAGECGDIASVTVIPVAGSVDLVSNGIITNETTIAENPQLIQAVVSAFDRGLRDAINNPAQAYLISLDYVEGLPINDALQAALEGASEVQQAFLETEPDHEAITASNEALFAELSNEFPPEDLIQFQVLLATIDLWQAEVLGMTDPASWETTSDLLVEMGLLTGDVDLAIAYTNDFVPAMMSED
ncbi:MAG: ABC transporter substrate-binding protein [Aggregatilineales bacterium]